ncbi:SURF1 family protein [Luteipulveratus flavus]|uniref:SURF1-like protein n=1 Tax=Luteipulveratus flavus TaxID=3031728 RepID=A0ABT6C4D1_9MICO|nr:SURF1 family protein [Luteipulveratus sp. YIM 133296]MDF8263142.1 SURF1 family protein [Luteipulveratus sp. YIM 133296]
MLQTALRPRNLALLALAVVAAVVFVLLGRWQWGVAGDDARAEALRQGQQRPVVALTDYLQPHAPFPNNGSLQRVRATGTYDTAHQVLVADRRLDGRAGLWVVTPLVVDGTGARLAVLRGFVTSPEQATAPLVRRTTVVGALAPSESPAEGTGYPSGQIGSVDIGALINVWGGEAYNAFVFGISEQPSATPASITKVPPPKPEVGHRDWRNVGYAFQWWAFAAFALYFWWRSVQEDRRDELGRGRAHDGPAPDPITQKDLHV